MSVSLSGSFPPFVDFLLYPISITFSFHSKSNLLCSLQLEQTSVSLSMATLTGASSSSSYMCLTNVSPPLPSTSSFPISLLNLPNIPRHSCFSLASPVTGTRKVPFHSSFSRDDEFGDFVEIYDCEVEIKETSETRLYSFAPFPLLLFLEAVVLFAMGGYGTYLGFCIRYSDNAEEKVNAKDLHPKLLGGMFFFLALGATGGITSLLTSDKPIFEGPHAVSGFIGLTLLTIQTLLTSLCEDNPGLRNVHGILGSGIMTLFLIHAALGLGY